MYRFHLNERYCKGCLICVEVCPKQAINSSNRMNGKGYTLPVGDNMACCTGCKLCEIVCPDFAIAIEGTAPHDEKADDGS